MRALAILSLALVVLLGSCKKDDKDDPGFTSAEGSWTYTTPDGKIKVDFDIVKDGSTWSVKDESTITVDGQEGASAVAASDVNPPTIGTITINANDTKITYEYFVTFVNLKVSDDFKTIGVASGTYEWPRNEHNTLTNITITRK